MMAQKIMAGASGGESILSPNHPDLLAMWDMGDTVSGVDMPDLSPNGKDGVITGADIVTGVIGDGLDFVDNPNGTANPAAYVDTPLVTTAGDYSLCLWVDINTTRKSRGVMLGWSEPVASGGKHQFFGYYDDSQFIRISIFDGTTFTFNSGTVDIPDGWRFLCIVREGAFYSLYVDAVFDQTWASGSEDLKLNTIGTYRTPNNRPGASETSVHSRWVYDQIRIFGIAVNQSEVNTMFGEV